MELRSFFFSLFLVISLKLCSVFCDDLVIETSKGWVRGFTDLSSTPERTKVDCWMGIPYAEPPIDHLRFRHPVPVRNWLGIKEARRYANSCPQLIDTVFGDFVGSKQWNPVTPLSEDCLFINIFAPRPRPLKAPVMVWIHGGGFYSGASTLDVYDPKTLAATENVIVVQMQYRLGSFGFLYLGIPDAPGNAGIFDQLMALEFIKKNIEKFGGDPNKVTLFGNSAGAAAISMHLISPLSNHLFNQAILQSGSATSDWATITKEEGKTRARNIAKALNCPYEEKRPEDTAECLRGINMTTLISHEWKSSGTWGIYQFPMVPVLDGVFLDMSPEASLRNGYFKNTPLLIGSNSEEGNYFLLYYLTELFKRRENVEVDRDAFLGAVATLNTNLSKFGREAVIFEYTENPNDPVQNREQLDKMVGDKHMTCDVNELALKYSEAGNNVFKYYFTHRSSKHHWPSWMGVLVADEINFVFGKPLDPSKGYTREETMLSRFIMHSWGNFARNGNPSLESNRTLSRIVWPVHTVNGREYLELSVNTVTKIPQVGHGPRLKQCTFWKSFLPQLLKQMDTKCSASYSSSSQVLSAIAIMLTFSFY